MLMFKPFTRFFDFSGRATRKEYWLFVLFYLAAFVILLTADIYLGLADESAGLLSSAFGYGAFIPWMAVSVRRLHDSDRHGAWMFLWAMPLIIMSDTLINHPSLYASLYGIEFIDPSPTFDPDAIYWWEVLFIAAVAASIIGLVWFIVLMCLKGSQGKNRFGSPDKPTNK